MVPEKATDFFHERQEGWGLTFVVSHGKAW